MLLLDTQSVVRLVMEREKLSGRAANAIRESRARNEALSIAAVTFWEVALLDVRGRIELDRPLDEFLLLLEQYFDVLPLTRRVAAVGAGFSKEYPGDPADRQIGATALVHGLTLITSDKKIRKSGEVPCIW